MVGLAAPHLNPSAQQPLLLRSLGANTYKTRTMEKRHLHPTAKPASVCNLHLNFFQISQPTLLEFISRYDGCPTSSLSLLPFSTGSVAAPAHSISFWAKSIPIGTCHPADLPKPVWQDFCPRRSEIEEMVSFFTTATAQ